MPEYEEGGERERERYIYMYIYAYIYIYVEREDGGREGRGL